jgi:hypothetical protein
VLPESVRQRLLLVIAREQERAAREPETPPLEQTASQARSRAPAGTDPPRQQTPPREKTTPTERAAAPGKAGSPHKAGHPEPAAPAGPFAPLPRQPPGADDGPARPPEASWDALPAPPSVVRADALTEPFPRFSAPVTGSPIAQGVIEIPPRPEQSASVPDAPAAAVADAPAAAVPDAPAAAAPDAPAAAVSAPHGRVAGQQAGRGHERLGRRYRVAGVLVSVAALIIAGSLALTLRGHSANADEPGSHRQRPAAPNDQAVRDQAAAWVAAQVGRRTIVSADPVMCHVLESHGIPATDVYELGPETTSPLRSRIIVATAAVRTQFGTLLNSVYAPAVLASFGSGSQRIDIRQIAPRGAAAYRSMLAADLAVRKSSGAELLQSPQITVSPMARDELSAGQVDSRLQITLAAMAAKRPIYVVAFNGFAPGADADLPLRFADLVPASPRYVADSRLATSAFVRTMIAFLRSPSAPYPPLRVEKARLPGGQTVLRIEFAAPSPLGLLGPP